MVSPSRDTKVLSLYDTDNREEIMFLEKKYLSQTYFDRLAYANVLQRYNVERSFLENTAFIRNMRRIAMKKTSRGKLLMFKKMDNIIISPDEELNQHIQRFRKQTEELKQLTTSVNNFIKNMNKVNTTEMELMTTWRPEISSS